MTPILLVEDDPFLIDVYTTKLEERGFKVEVAKDGEECFKKIEDIKPSLILLDIVLPTIDGWQILRKLKNEKKLDSLKIVILSNLGQKEEVEKGLDLGADKYLIKAHHTPTEVVQVIEKVLK